MVGNERFDVEHEYQGLIGGPEIDKSILDGTFVERESGYVFQLQECHPKNDLYFENGKLNKLGNMIVDSNIHTEDRLLEQEKERANRPYSDPRSYFPAEGLPEDSVLVVRTKALIDLQRRLLPKEDPHYAHTEKTFLNTKHPFFAEELKIAVEAWAELYEKKPPMGCPTRGHKKYIQKWLKEKNPGSQ